MSAMVVLDARLNMNEVITITEDEIDRLKGTGSRLSVGTQLTRAQLLHLSLMSSENRATHALGRTYPGGMSAFVAAMNAKAQSLGMTNSRFYEPTGLDYRNVSTAWDLNKLAAAASNYVPITKTVRPLTARCIPARAASRTIKIPMHWCAKVLGTSNCRKQAISASPAVRWSCARESVGNRLPSSCSIRPHPPRASMMRVKSKVG